MPNNLFIDIMMNNIKAGMVEFILPNADASRTSTKLVAWLAENPSIKLGNTWQAALPSIDALTKMSNFSNSTEVVTWLSGAQSAWVGAEPLTISVTFYLFSMSDKSNIRKEIFKLESLALINMDNGTATSGSVHGGYKPDVLGDSVGYIDNSFTRGFIKINVGSQMKLDKMLLVDVTPENSMLEVADGNPLYIKATASFKSYRPLTVSELQSMLLGSNNSINQ